ncbi:aldo/keto reductase [Shimia sp. R9_3]|uniref:aldo/keto reductase n=1 Tax=Shimia sp. R9_3 TaxID=2821113 RepID=UPI001ADA786E|nr:aldo/keto reductase [Shimia sp. R9_3]MBO9399954.1 aldo/keto reductase [Shimia sp. R9_3]
MKYKSLGNTGLYVSELTLGTMTFSEGGGSYADVLGATGQELATRMVDLAIEAGINIFDTANVYSAGESETLLGKALGARRKDAVIATKLYGTEGTGPNDLGTSRLAIMREVEASLTRLGTDYIDLYQVHSFDPTTPLEETLRAMDDLVRQGKVRYIGLSNFSAWQIAKADGVAKLMGTEKFCSVQSYYSLVGRALEREIIPAAMDLGLGTLIWSPLAGGFLSGKFTREGQEKSARRANIPFPPIDMDKGYDVVDVLAKIAANNEVSVAQVALAWLLHKPGVTSVIVGARKESQLVDNLGATNVALSDDEIAQLDAVSALEPEYPNYMPKADRGDDLMGRLRNDA